ncbi:hypothetical protein V3481_019243 [Fusarium oxysporum f. sp. vasinfectum]
MLLGRLSRALDQQPRTRRPSGKHRESSTLELAAEHGRRGAFVSCRVWLRFAYNGTGRRVVKDGPHIQDYLPWTPSMNVAIDDQIDRSGLVIDRYRSTGSSDRSIDIDIESINRIDQIDWSIDFEAWLEESIRLEEDIAGASVSGHLRSSNRTFIIRPANSLTANLHGFQENVCKEEKGDKHYDSRICKPTRRVNLKKGNTIDFTFGLTSSSRGFAATKDQKNQALVANCQQGSGSSVFVNDHDSLSFTGKPTENLDTAGESPQASESSSTVASRKRFRTPTATDIWTESRQPGQQRTRAQ